MPYVLNEIVAPDVYEDVATIKTDFPCVRVNMQVTGATLAYCLRDSDTQDWGREQIIGGLPGALTFVSLDRNCTGIRIRNFVAGKVATATVELYLPSDISEGMP